MITNAWISDDKQSVVLELDGGDTGLIAVDTRMANEDAVTDLQMIEDAGWTSLIPQTGHEECIPLEQA